MKKDPAPDEDDDTRTPWERFLDAARHVVSVPKEEVERREKAWRKQRKS